LSFGKVIANGATNIIPNEVYLEGTFRTLNEEWRNRAHQLMVQQAEGIAQSMGGSVDFRIEKGYPFLTNDPALTSRAMAAAKAFLGNDNVIDLDVRMTAEDFSWYTQLLPACFYRLGTSSPDGQYKSSVHTPNFNIDENALQTGMGLMAWLAVDELGS
jgi:metal-dependent amidase/aminoacylase/carboxypeptidase family protein